MRQRVVLIMAGVAAALVVAGCGHGGVGGNQTVPGGSAGHGAAGGPVASAPPAPTSSVPGAGTHPTVPGPVPAPPGTSHTYTFVPPPPKPARTPVAASQVTVRNLPPGASGQAWTADGGRTVGTTVEVKGCERADARPAGQSAQRVVMVVGITNTQHKGQMCPMIIRNVVVTVRLDAPLGHRQLLLQGG